MAADGAPRAVADVGSPSGALAVGGDGALWFGDGPRLWRVALPGEGTAKPSAPELVADGLGDVYGVVLLGDDSLAVSDWEGGRVLSLARARPDANGADEKASRPPPTVLAKGLHCPSGLVALADGSLLVKESGRRKNVAARLLRIARNGAVETWVDLRRDDTR